MTDTRPAKLAVIVCSTRPGRIGDKIATWFHSRAVEQGHDAELLDIAAFDLPIYNESRHSRLGDYEHEHTKRWAAAVGQADGFAFVAPEYNHGPSPALVNALTYLGPEWAKRPAGFVSYGGRSGGLRAVQATKPILSALMMYPTKTGMVIPFAGKLVSDTGFKATAEHENEAAGFLKELRELATHFKTLRHETA